MGVKVTDRIEMRPYLLVQVKIIKFHENTNKFIILKKHSRYTRGSIYRVVKTDLQSKSRIELHWMGDIYNSVLILFLILKSCII